MKQYVQIFCPYCDHDDIVKNGHSENGTQRYVCKGCRRSFQWEYTYRAWLPEVKDQIDTQTCNGSGIRDISRNLGISKTTVMAELEKKEPAEVNLQAHAGAGIDVDICTEGDEFWSFVHDKSQQRWTWYVIERTRGTILAHHNDRRTDAACQALLKKLEIFPIRTYYTDNWQSYAKFIDADKHVIGKQHTQKIERTNLNFRTHIKRLQRKTICFSKKERLHDNVIGLYIEREYYHKCNYAQVA
jgi:insertion element IS1 protein InsB